MMRRNLYILAIASLLSGNYVFAQDAVKQWSLEECIQYAIEHNIELKAKGAGTGKPKGRLTYQQIQLAPGPKWQSWTELPVRTLHV